MKFRPRFSLRTLLIVVTLSAVASWAYWIGLPWWHDRAQQSRFVDAVRQLKVGTPIFIPSILPSEDRHGGWVTLAIDKNTDGEVISKFWPNATYCAYWTTPHADFDGHTHLPIPLRIELYRLPPVPPDYRSMLSTPLLPVRDYQNDFLTFLNGDRKNNPGFKYELLYCDPPISN